MLSKDLQALIHQLELTTRKQVSGPLLGDAVSKLKGSGFEFNQLREYIQGDDIRFIDWKASARSGKTLVRQYLEDRNRVLYIVVDVSASMNYGTKGQTKADFIKQLGAVLAFVGLHGKDSVGLVLFSNEIEQVIPPRQSRAHTLHIVKTLLNYVPKSKKTNLGVAFDYLARLKGQKALVCMLSDFMGDLGGSLMKVAARKHDLLAFRCLDQNEITFPEVGSLVFEDKETGQQVAVAQGQVQALARFNELQRDKLVNAKIDLLGLEVGTPYTGDVLQFLRQRMIGRR